MWYAFMIVLFIIRVKHIDIDTGLPVLNSLKTYCPSRSPPLMKLSWMHIFLDFSLKFLLYTPNSVFRDSSARDITFLILFIAHAYLVLVLVLVFTMKALKALRN